MIKRGVFLMLVLTFQKKEIAQKIRNGSYHVSMSKSTFAYSSLRFTIGYKSMISSLQSKGVELLPDEGVIWAWVSSPSKEMVKNYLRKGYVALYIDIDPSKCVMSDYYKFSDYVTGDSTEKDYILDRVDSTKECIQCAFTVDCILNVRAEYSIGKIILYNSIARSYYAMQLYNGINQQAIECNTMFSNVRYKLEYMYNKCMYIYRKVFSVYVDNWLNTLYQSMVVQQKS